MRASRRDIVIVLACLGLGILLSAIFFGASSGRWQASGDGKTIFNNRTGDLMYIHSGELVKEVVEREKAEKAAAEAATIKAAQEKQRRKREDAIALKKKEEAERPAKLAKSKARLIAATKAAQRKIEETGISSLGLRTLYNLTVEAEELKSLGLTRAELADLRREPLKWYFEKESLNDKIFQQLKEFVESKTPPEGAQRRWEPATRPFRLRDMLSEEERNELLEVLGIATMKRRQSDLHKDEYHRAIELLKEYDTATQTTRLHLGGGDYFE